MVRCLTPFGMTGLRWVKKKGKNCAAIFPFLFLFLPQMHVFSSKARNLFNPTKEFNFNSQLL